MPHPRARAGQSPLARAVVTSLRVALGALAVLHSAAPVAAGGKEALAYKTNLGAVRELTQEAVEELFASLPPPSGPRVRLMVDPPHQAGWLVEEIAGNALRARGHEVVIAKSTAPPPAVDTTAAAGAGAGAGGSQSPADSAAAHKLGLIAGLQGAEASGDTSAIRNLQQQIAHHDSLVATAPWGGGGSQAGSQGGGTGSNGDAPGSEASGMPPAPPPLVPEEPVDGEIHVRVVELGLKYTDTHRTWPLFGSQVVERFAGANLTAELQTPDDDLVRWAGSGDATRIDEVPKDMLPILEGLDSRNAFATPELPAGGSRLLEPIIVSAIVVGLVFLFVSNRS
jgi:hypothetical protein